MHTLSYTAAPDITRIIRNHAARYPESEPQDVVKLLYQSVFGPGHLVSDPNAAAERLLHELKNSPSRESVFNDEIGGGFARLHLIPGTDPDYALFAFLKSARSVGSSHELLKAFETLYHLSGEDALTFDTQSLNRYLDDYRAAGCPMVSHSAAYRGAYAPSYRVVHREFVLLEPLIRKIRSLTSEKDHTVVVLDGFCASGKSTLAYFLQEIFAARLIHMDDFFLPPEKRTPERFAQPGGNVDYERFRTEVIEHLAEESLTYGVFDCGKMAIDSHVTLPKTAVTIIEGSYSHHPFFGKYYDTDVFMETSSDEQRRRILERDGEEYFPMFESRWIPFEQAYESAYHVRDGAEFLIQT